jgi:hypothetical protein
VCVGREIPAHKTINVIQKSVDSEKPVSNYLKWR